MSSRRGVLARWLLVGLIAFGLALSGPAHHSLCHDHGGGEEAHAHGHCCEVSSDSDGPIASSHDGDHACPLCFLSIDVPPTPVVVLGPPLEGTRSREPVVLWIPRLHRRLAESERGPPVLV